MNADDLHLHAYVVDAHSDILADVRSRRRRGETHVIVRRHLDRLRAGGFKAMVFAIFLTPYMPESALRETLLMIDDLNQEIVESAGTIHALRTQDDLLAEPRPGSMGIFLSLEGAEPLGFDLAILRLLHELGLRALGLTWVRRTLLADGNQEGDAGGGLSRFGRDVVRECGRLGILVDVSHLTRAAFWDVMRVATGPVIASHSNARQLCDHPRNLDDEQLRALASSGGAVGLNAIPDFVDAAAPTLGRLLDHAEHMLTVMGSGHVGLGLDLVEYLPGYEDTRLPGLGNSSGAPAITAQLLQRGVSKEEIHNILGQTWLRLWRQILR